MRPFWGVFVARFRLLLRYRAAAAAGFSTQIFWGLMRVMIFCAFLDSATGAAPMTRPELVGYLWLAQALLATLPWNIEPDIGAAMRSGGVVYELARPVGLWSLWFARHLAFRTAPTILRCVPMLVLAWAFFGLQLPASPGAAAAFAVSVAAAIVLSAAISTLMAVSLLWTVAGEGVVLVGASLVMLLSGLAVPIPLFPDRFQELVRFLPFRGLMDSPYRLYLGTIPLSDFPATLAHQLLWTAVFVAAGIWLARRGLKRLVVQGG